MSKLERTIVVSAAVAALTLGIVVQPAQAGDEGPAMSEEIQKEMAIWMKLAQPGEQHEHMKPFVGSWKGEVSSWMAPDTPPMVNASTSEVKWMLGGRYLEWTHIGDFGGMPFEARAIEGYSYLDERFESIWIDNFGTVMLFFTGTGSADGKTREMKTSFSDPVNGGTIEYRTIYEWIDDDHFTYTSFMNKGNGEFKNMEIKYERQ
jgi:hypothetical protein